MSPFLISGFDEKSPMLLRLLDLLYPHSTGLVLRDLGDRVKSVVGEDVCRTFSEVEGNEDLALLDIIGDLGGDLDLSAAGDGLDLLAVGDPERLGVIGADLDPSGGGLALEVLGAPGHRTGVELPEAAAGGEDERVLGVRDFGRVLELDGRQD